MKPHKKIQRKAWKTGFKVMKKEKCISKGVTIGGDNADVLYASIH